MRILVVDDDRDIREFLKANLQTECFIVDTAGDGEDGSFLARTREYDVIILDNIMPRKSGYEVCRELRAAGKTTPIIMLSVQADVENRVDLLDLGADDFVPKPFSFRELRARIRALMRRPKDSVATVLTVGDLVLDTANQRVRRGTRDIYLTRKEFALTEYLMRNRGAVVSRGMLMEHVWEEDVDPFSNTIESHILNLRKKIDRVPKKKLIHTVPGRGYKIESSNRMMVD
ncbi:MAG TPA: response regulator transcription factor [Candidatus Paceibacterota bacterium]|jgi:Response regulators consisting of a CheY-like receiver domain and a winged-helix DNA-binding domain